jgi:hypothetical protein
MGFFANMPSEQLQPPKRPIAGWRNKKWMSMDQVQEARSCQIVFWAMSVCSLHLRSVATFKQCALPFLLVTIYYIVILPPHQVVSKFYTFEEKAERGNTPVFLPLFWVSAEPHEMQYCICCGAFGNFAPRSKQTDATTDIKGNRSQPTMESSRTKVSH